jgi:SanA protein
LRDRVDTAIDLYRAGKVQKLLMSGDNQIAEYNEPADMMAYAITQGVPAQDIQPDYGGRRTYDTCYRAKSIFQVDAAILVTQQFHLPRALFTCRALGINAQGVVSELPALVVALVDVVRREPPPVMGEPIPIQ